MKTPAWPFYLFVIGLAILIISPVISADGMFMDGLMYAAISNNLALGIGDFWYPHFSKTLYPSFHEHPPLAFGIQSLFFKFFGEGRWIERAYSLFTFMITGLIMWKTWIQITGRQKSDIGWLPVLLWISVPLVTWAMCNNMLENTMMIFTGLSVFFMLSAQLKKQRLYLLLSGFCISLAFLTKGFTGLFVLSFPFWMIIFRIDNDFRRFITDTLVLTVSSGLPFVLLYHTCPEASDSLEKYFYKQVIGSIKSVQTVESRSYILKLCMSELLPMLITGALVLFFTRRISIHHPYVRWAGVFYGLAISGVAPIMISLKQSGFYILSTFPVFALATAVLIQPQAEFLLSRIRPDHLPFKVFKGASIIIFITGIALTVHFRDRFSRDETKLRDIYAVCKTAPDHWTIGIEPGLLDDWSLHAYFQRYAHISLDCSPKPECVFLLLRRNSSFVVPPSYVPASTELNMFALYQKKQPSDSSHLHEQVRFERQKN